MISTLEHRTTSKPKFHVARQARFGRAPRILPTLAKDQTTARRRSDIEKDFEASFTRMAHLQRYRAVRDALKQLGDITQRTCRSYVTFSDTHGVQFAVVKPLSDGGLRIGLGDFAGITSYELAPASGLGSSTRINYQFELPGHRVLSGAQLGLLRRAYLACKDVD